MWRLDWKHSPDDKSVAVAFDGQLVLMESDNLSFDQHGVISDEEGVAAETLTEVDQGE